MATLVTGASSGLGIEYARLAAAKKSDLVLVARSADKLEALAAEVREAHGVGVTVLADDLANPASVERIVASLREKGIAVDELINNAGVGKLAPFAGMPEEAIAGMIDLNVRTLTLLTRALLPDMVARGAGRILNVASTAAYAPGPLMAVYYASKAYVLHFSVALQNELRGSGVSVTCLCPGPTKTGFQKTADMMDAPMFKKLSTMDAAGVARDGYDGMRRGKAGVIAGWSNKVSAFLTRLAPKTLVASIARAAQES